MGNYKRKVTYFYQYHNGRIGATTGFMKLEIRGDMVGMTINIQESLGVHIDNPVLYFYHETPDNLSAVKICEVNRCGEVLTFQAKTSWERMFDTGRDLYSFDGVVVFYSKNDYYLGDFKDRDRSSYELVIKENKEDNNRNSDNSGTTNSNNEDIDNTDIANNSENIEVTDITKPDIISKADKPQNKDKEKNVQEKPVSMGNNKIKNDSFEDMLRDFPKLPMGGVQELFDCVRINLKDIGKLDISNWKLGVNSFLTHGYYTYQYLMLGKLRFDDGKKRAVLGVPGVYTNREKYLANMFGFDQFIPVRKNGVKTGQFGYWIVELAMHGDHY